MFLFQNVIGHFLFDKNKKQEQNVLQTLSPGRMLGLCLNSMIMPPVNELRVARMRISTSWSSRQLFKQQPKETPQFCTVNTQDNSRLSLIPTPSKEENKCFLGE